MSRYRLSAWAGIICLALCGVHVNAQDKIKIVSVKFQSYEDKLKEIENAYRKAIGEILHDLTDSEKKMAEIVKKEQLDYFKAAIKDKVGREKLKMQLDAAQKELSRIQAEKKMYEGRLAGMRAVLGWDKLDDRLGAIVKAPSPTLIEQLGLTKGQGVVVEFVPPKTLAAKAGVKPHDVMLKVGGAAVPSEMQAYKKFCHDLKVDAGVSITVLRHGKEVVLGTGNPPVVIPPLKNIDKKEPEKKN